jgi:hypothetical protein
MRTPYTTMIIKYPNGATQHVRPNMQHFQGNWEQLAICIAGQWFLDRSGNVMKIPFELR